MPINASDIPEGFTATPHPSGAGFVMDRQEAERYSPPSATENPVYLLPESAILAEVYGEMIAGNPTGVSAGMGGMLPEKLLWTTVQAYARQSRTKLGYWALNLLFMVDSIRLGSEFERMKKESAKK